MYSLTCSFTRTYMNRNLSKKKTFLVMVSSYLEWLYCILIFVTV